MFTITKSWLDQFRTPRGGWTKVQLEAIGVPWPPYARWSHVVPGTEITDEAKAAFEAGWSAEPQPRKLSAYDLVRLATTELRSVRVPERQDQNKVDAVLRRLDEASNLLFRKQTV